MRVALARVILSMALIWQLTIGDTLTEAASPVIGTVVSRGMFRVDTHSVTGNATLFSGATIETNNSLSALDLSSGARLVLGESSKAQVFSDHVLLEHGAGQLEKAAGLRVEARGLSIQPETGNSTGRVRLVGSNRVGVEAVRGSFRILNSGGVLVARVPQGVALALEPQPNSVLTRVSGKLDLRAGHFLLIDETTRVTVEVLGRDLAKTTGKRVEISGSLDSAVVPVSNASQVVRANKIVLLAQASGPTAASGSGGTTGGTGASAAGASGGGVAGSSTGAATGAAGGGAGWAGGGTAAAGTTAAGASGGILGSTAAIVAVVGGVAAAATVGGLVASGTIAGSDSEEPVSR